MRTILFTLLFIAFSKSLFSQNLEASEDTVLLEVIVKDYKNNLRKHDQILFEGKETHQSFLGTTDLQGKFAVLLPEGDIYDIKVKGLGENQKYNTLAIPKVDGIYSTNTLTITYEPARKFILKNLEFETAKSSIRKGSGEILNELYDLLILKPEMIIKISGHTDNVGDDSSNLLLSQNRADAVKLYLLKRGIAASRIQTMGYGESMPIKTNDTEEGRQQNRRTEVLIIKE